jgi:hypothetical protein
MPCLQQTRRTVALLCLASDPGSIGSHMLGRLRMLSTRYAQVVRILQVVLSCNILYMFGFNSPSSQ